MSEQAQGAATPVTMEQVQKMVNDGITAGIAAAMKPLNDQLGKLSTDMGKQGKAADAIGVRRRYMEEKMKDVPDIYLEKMPETADAGELALAEQAIRGMFSSDWKKSGAKTPDISGGLGQSDTGRAATLMPGTPGMVAGRQDNPSGNVSEGLRRIGTPG